MGHGGGCFETGGGRNQKEVQDGSGLSPWGSFLFLRAAVTIQAWWRGTLGRRKAARKKWAVETIRRYVKSRGFPAGVGPLSGPRDPAHLREGLGDAESWKGGLE